MSYQIQIIFSLKREVREFEETTHAHTRVFTGELLRAYELLQTPRFMT